MDDDQNLFDDTPTEDAPELDSSGAAPRPDPYEGAVPPGYDWPTHGGYLGCLIGLMASCLIGGFAAKLVGLYTYYHRITGFENVIVIVAVFGLAVIVCANLGWRLGRRFFREYAQRPTWGENDTYIPDAVAVPLPDLGESEEDEQEVGAFSTERSQEPRFDGSADQRN